MTPLNCPMVNGQNGDLCSDFVVELKVYHFDF